MALYMERTKVMEPMKPMPDDDMIICRCEEITKGEIRQAIHEGMYTMNEIKRFIRPGMGLCQGQSLAFLTFINLPASCQSLLCSLCLLISEMKGYSTIKRYLTIQ